MTHAYKKVAASSDPSHVRSDRSVLQSLLAQRRTRAGRSIDSEPWLDAVSGRGIGVRGNPRASYVLHKDPNGSWFIDQWKQDAASGVRPVTAGTHERDQASPATNDHAELCFIIDIS